MKMTLPWGARFTVVAMPPKDGRGAIMLITELPKPSSTKNSVAEQPSAPNSRGNAERLDASVSTDRWHDQADGIAVPEEYSEVDEEGNPRRIHTRGMQ